MVPGIKKTHHMRLVTMVKGSEEAIENTNEQMLYTVMYMTPDELREAIHNQTSAQEEPIAEQSPESSAHSAQPATHTEDQTQKHSNSEVPQKGPEAATFSNPQVVYTWTAPLRAYKKKPAGVFRFYFAVAVLLSIISIFLREYLLTIPIWSTMFLIYALTITPPHDIINTITKFGLQTGSNTYRWEELSYFYFIKKFDYHLLVVFTKLTFGHPVYLVIPNEDTKHQVLHLLAEHLVYQESPQKTFADKMAEWLTSLMPEEIEIPPVTYEEQPPSHHRHEPTEEPLHQQIPQPHPAPSQGQ